MMGDGEVARGKAAEKEQEQAQEEEQEQQMEERWQADKMQMSNSGERFKIHGEKLSKEGLRNG